ncbi:MAG TPA: lipocalin family protein [Pseudoxanthomonas sp.]|nr:lipocalin family protein [Pseudoxanthomonas sp.]
MRALSSLLLLCLAMPAAAALADEPVASVPELDLSRYAGQWYEIAHLPVSFQRKCAGDITAHYTLRSDGSIGVRNACRTHGGELAAAEGVGRPVPGHPGRLQVRFAPDWLSWLPMVWADYWVIALDPGYQWAVVGDPDREYLWILSREPSMERALFDRLRAQATAMGYDLAPLVVAAPLREPPAAP